MIGSSKKGNNLGESLDAKMRTGSPFYGDGSKGLPQISQKMKKWQEVSRSVSQELEICKIINQSHFSHHSLKKTGGDLFQISKRAESPKNYKISRPITSKQTNKSTKALQKFRVSQKTKGVIKRSSRQFIDIKSSIQYDRPVLYIGSNMQYQQKLVKYHIENVKKVQIVEPTPMPIIFCIKSETQVYNACITTFKNQEMPICISLFAESFDAKLEQSAIKKKQYLSAMIKEMYGTYDPQMMSRMPLPKKNALNVQQFFNAVRVFPFEMKQFQKFIFKHILDKIRKNIPIQSSQKKSKELKQQALKNFEEGCCIAKLDYYLKNPQNLREMNFMRQYLCSKKQNIVSFRVCYHGGYSKALYASWNKYVRNCETQLPKKVFKFCPKVQKIQDWMQNFKQLNLVEIKLFEVLISPISLNQLKQIQRIKISQIFGIFRNVCIKGALTILDFDRFLLKDKSDFCIAQEMKKIEYLCPKGDKLSILKVNLNSEEQLLSWFFQTLQGRHKYKTLSSLDDLTLIEDLINIQISESERKKVNKSVQLLINIFYSQLVSKSLKNFMNFFIRPSEPCLKLSLIVDRQSIKLQQSEDSIIDSFTSILQEIMGNSLHVTSQGMEIKQEQAETYKQYGNLFLPNKKLAAIESHASWDLKIEYKNQQIQQKGIKQLVVQLKQWYHQCQTLIQNFAPFMPFIKLTAKQKIFIQQTDVECSSQWEQAQQLFKINKDKIQIYRQKLGATPKKFNVGVFEVDCSQPHRVLKDRISQLQYLFQQKYLSKVFAKIQEMEHDLSRIMTCLHSYNIRVHTMKEIEQSFQKSKQQLMRVKDKTKQLARHIYFYVQKQSKSNVLITRFSQLISKRIQLLSQIEELKVRIKQQSQYQEIKRGEQMNKLRNEIWTYQQKLSKFCKQYFEMNKISRSLEMLKNMEKDFSSFKTEFDSIKNPNCEYDDEQKLFKQTNHKIRVVYNFWFNFNSFNLIIKQLNKNKMQNVQISHYESTVQSSISIIKQFEDLSIQTNQINDVHFKKFKEQVAKHSACLQYVQILTNRQIPLQYFTMFGCEDLLNLTFKDFHLLKNFEDFKPKLKQLEIKAQAQQKILQKYKRIEKIFSTLNLTIVDYNGCDTLDPQITDELVETLRQSCFECERLLLQKYFEKYEDKIKVLLQSMTKCQEIIKNWLQIQRKFLKINAFYQNNDDAQFKDSFKNISEAHRKIIKSFDLDNSLIIIPSNMFLFTSLQSLQSNLHRITNLIFQKFNLIQSCQPRLHLLNHEQLLQMLSSVTLIPKHLHKCFPDINHFNITEESIDRIGGHVGRSGQTAKFKKIQFIEGNYIELAEPIYLGSRLINTQVWLQKLISDIKQNMKHIFLKQSKKDQCLQIQILKLGIQFTEEIQQLLSDQQDQPNKFEVYTKALITKIDEKRKQHSPRYNLQINIMFLLMQRDICSSLSQSFNQQTLSKESFQWLKHPRFYNFTHLGGKKVSQIDVRVSVINEIYPYCFNFIQKCQLIYQNALFVGNCIVGAKGSGKKKIVKHHAYLTGNQLFVFEQNRISSNFIQNTVNFFKLAITSGSWLLLPNICDVNEDQMRVVAECLSSLSLAIQSKASKMEIFVYNQFPVNQNCKIFFTLSNFSSVPSRLSHNFRPIWVTQPSSEFICSLYNEAIKLLDSQNSKNMVQWMGDNIDSNFKIVDFTYWNRQNKQVPLIIANSFLVEEWKSAKIPAFYPNPFFNSLLNCKFLLKSDLGQSESEDIDWILENCSFSIFYLCRTQFFRFINNNFCDENSVTVSFNNLNFESSRQIFHYLKRRMKKNNIEFLLVENSLQQHYIIEREIFDQSFSYKKVKVVYLQTIQSLKQDESLRVLLNFPTIILPDHEIKIKTSSKEQMMSSKQKKIDFKNAYLNSEIIIDLDPQLEKVIQSLMTQHLQNNISTKEIKEALKIFNKLRIKMIQKQYSKEVSFCFALTWAFGNFINQKHILNELLSLGDNFELNSIFTRCISLKQLYPTKNSFILNRDDVGDWFQIVFKQGTSKFKSVVLSNLKLIKSLFDNELLVFKSQLSISDILHFLFPQDIHFYSASIGSPIQAKNKLQRILKIQAPHSSKRFIIHSADKLNPKTLIFLNTFAERGYCFFEESGQFKSFKTEIQPFVYSTSRDEFKLKIDSVEIKIFQDEIISFERDLLQSMLIENTNKNSFTYSIMKGITISNKSNIDKYYWFQLPIRLVLRKYLQNKKVEQNFFLWLLPYVFISIPDEKTKLVNEICYSGPPALNQAKNQKSEKSDFQIQINSLVETNTFLETHISEIELQIRKNICKNLIILNSNLNTPPYVYEMIYRTFLTVSESHTILLGQTYSQRLYCLEMCAKILNTQIVRWHPDILTSANINNSQNSKIFLLINEEEVSEQILAIIEAYLCQQQNLANKKYTIILKLRNKNDKTEQYYRKYPYLKKYFFQVCFPDNQDEQVTKNINLVKTLKNLENGMNKYELNTHNDWQIAPQIQLEKQICKYFGSKLNKNFGFLLKLLEIKREVEEEEFNKYRFYRTLTEQLFHILAKLDKQLTNIPLKLEQMKIKEQTQRQFSVQVKQGHSILNTDLSLIANEHEATKQIMMEKLEVLDQLREKAKNYKQQLAKTFNKIYMKFQNLGIQEHSRFKQTSDNQLTHSIYTFVSTLIKWQSGKLKKIPIAKLQTLAIDNVIKQDKNKDIMKKILTNWKNNKKKNEKINPIFLALIQWMQAIDIYLLKGAQQNSKVCETITEFQVQVQQLKQQCMQSEQKLNLKQEQIKQCEQIISSNTKDQNKIAQSMELLNARQARISQILKQVMDKEYKIKISKDLAERLYFIPKIIMSKAISQIGINQYEDDIFIANQLFLKSSKDQTAKEIKNQELFKYDVPFSHNIFDDYDTVVDIYNKYKLIGFDYDQVKIIHDVLLNKKKVQIIEDAHSLVSQKLCQIFGTNLDFKILNFIDSGLEQIKKEISQKANSYPRILANLSRFDRNDEIQNIFTLLLDLTNQHQNLKIILIFQKYETTYENDCMRSISEGKVTLNFRRFLKQFSKIVYERSFDNQWDYYQSQYDFNKAHKLLFEVVQNFQPQNEQSYNKMVDVIKKLQAVRSRRYKLYQHFEQYYEFLSTIYSSFHPYFILIKFIQSIDRFNSIEMFESDSLFKYYQIALKKAYADTYDNQMIGNQEQLLKKFILHFSYLLNFMDHHQVDQFCYLTSFLLKKPKNITYGFILTMLRDSNTYKKQSERIQYMIKTVTGTNVSLTLIQQKLPTKNLQSICEDWLQSLIIATSSNYHTYSEVFYNKMKYSPNFTLLTEIRERKHSDDPHYYVAKSKLDLKNQFKSQTQTSRMRQCKTCWIMKVKKENSQKLMERIEAKVGNLKQDIKLVNFFFNEDKLEGNFSKLKELSEKKMFVCIFNLSKQKQSLADEIIIVLNKNKNIHPMFKLFILCQDRMQLRNRKHIDYIEFTAVAQVKKQEVYKKRMVSEIQKLMGNTFKEDLFRKNKEVINSIQTIIKKCSHKLSFNMDQQRMLKFLYPYLLSPEILQKEGNVLKFLSSYFKVPNTQILEICKIKQTLMVFQEKPSQSNRKVDDYSTKQNLPKWVNFLQKIDECTSIQSRYLLILKTQIKRVIEDLITEEKAKMIINETNMKNIIRFGWVHIQNFEMLKFLLYKGLREGLIGWGYGDNFEIIRDLRIVCERDNKKIGLKLEEFNQCFAQNLVQEYELKIVIIEDAQDQSLILKSDLEGILEHYNMRLSLGGDKQTLGALFITFK